jgi:lipopolysaccharide transport system permease protein
MNKIKKTDWLFVITPKAKLINLDLKEIWQYRDLLMLFVKRDVITLYKQTILGPLWYLIQPLFTSVIFTLVFNNVAGIKTGSIPPFLFNLAGITIWNYFRECLTATSDTFKKNESIFGKVYFPRIIMPLSIIVSNLLKFGIQSLIFIAFYLYYVVIKHVGVAPNIYLLLFPLLVLCMAMLGLGLGMVISSMVTKYRDLTFLVSFGVQLLMYISLVVIPFSLFQEKGVEWLVKYNPMAYIIEFGRFMLLGEGNISQFGIIYTVGFSVLVLLIGTVIFNKTEKTFIDTI